jgi:glycosyltransferase involved in cell wall biosynthesis
VLFPGHVDVPRIKALMELSLAGLAPYRDLENFRLNVPNKVFEYAAGGLPVLSAVDGEVGRLLREHGMGAVYSAGNAQTLADLVSALATAPQSARAQGARARALFEQSFDARVVSRQIESYLLGMVAGLPSGKPNGRL